MPPKCWAQDASTRWCLEVTVEAAVINSAMLIFWLHSTDDEHVNSMKQQTDTRPFDMMTTVGVNVSDWLVTGQHGRFVMGERRSSDEPGRQVTSNTNDELFIQDKTDELTMWHKSDEAALTSHFDSGKVSPGFSSPAGLVGDWGSAGGMGMGIGRVMGWLWPSGLSGPRLDVGWPMITVQPAGLEHENTISCSMTACLKKPCVGFTSNSNLPTDAVSTLIDKKLVMLLDLKRYCPIFTISGNLFLWHRN